MKVSLIFTGKTTEKYLREGVDDYTERIRRYSSFEIICLPELKHTRNMPVREQKEKEGITIMRSLRNDDYVILLDEKGIEYSTSEFSAVYERILMMARKRLVFIIGGAWGFSDGLYARADMKVSLSRMTFSHQTVRLLFLEQLYRICTIIKGDPYHHD